VAKRLLPVVALALLSLVALWPELERDEASRWSSLTHGLEPQSGRLTQLRYNGVDQNNHPFTITATTAQQVSPRQVDLVDPKGDLSLPSGSWLFAQAERGVYRPHSDQLDLSGQVTLYRDDGLTLVTHAATLDLKAGAAAGADKVHAEGPFGQLDAQGFAVTDQGAVVQFSGPGRLLLNGSNR
jgi:lipopolysaccharide export system protein LptC